MICRFNQHCCVLESEMSFRAPRRVCLNGNKWFVGPRLHPPRPTMRIDNDLLSRMCACDTTRDCVDPLPPALCGWRDLGELDGWSGAALLGMASLNCKADTQNKAERPCEVFRRNACHASRSAS